MVHDIIRQLLIKNFSEFEYAFSQAKSIYVDEKGYSFHNLEYGEYRERVLVKLLKTILPNNLDVGTGFIVNSEGVTSTQCDIVIFDKNETPALEGDLGQRFFPVECVVAVGEVKSSIDSVSKLNEYIKKLNVIAEVKNIIQDTRPVTVGDDEYEPKPIIDPKDSLFTFIVCSDFKFKLDLSKIEDFGRYPANKLNCVLSLKDGLICRKKSNGVICHYPISESNICDLHFIENDEQEFKVHFRYFTSLLRLMSECSRRFKVDISYYIFERKGIDD
ncbi:hypothetical protein L5152_004222 [Vibrio vulnificus]|nr:hypothetical protein [Vibrio vulnificus]HAS8245884.1 hypothetical protein [Vibrio vulnificus]